VTERELVGRVPLDRETLTVVGVAGHVPARAEPVVGPGQADRVERGLVVGPDRGALDRAIHVLGEGVAPLRPIDAQVQHPAPDLGPEVGRTEVGNVEVEVRAGHDNP
jgi:hypothetical protein